MRQNVLLKNYTTSKTGGEARYLLEIHAEEDFAKVIDLSKKESLPIIVLGGGSNTVISDSGLDAIVITLKNNTIEILSENKEKLMVKVGAGVIWDEFVDWSVDKNLQGIESLSLIPGSVGAAPMQNIGAYGQEVKNTIKKVIVFDTKTQKLTTYSNKDCEFTYRSSIFKDPAKKHLIIYEVVFELHKNKKPVLIYKDLIYYFSEKKVSKPSLQEVRQAVIDIRTKKLEDPKQMPNAGSFFKNPTIKKHIFEKIKLDYPEIPFHTDDAYFFKIPAAWLIEQVGWKGKKYKNVGVSQKHALIIVNPQGRGTAEEIMELSQKIQRDVHDKFGVRLTSEVQFLQ